MYVAHVGPDHRQVTGTRRISGDVAQGPAPELAVLVRLPTIDIDRVIGETIADVSHLERAGYACAGRRINLDDQVLVTSSNEVGGVLESYVDAAVGCNRRD